MNSIFSILLVFSYLTGSLGLKVNQHFCCGELVKQELLLGQIPKNCQGEPIQKKSKCCTDKVQDLKVDQGKHPVKIELGQKNFQFLSLAPTNFQFNFLSQFSDPKFVFNTIPGPPPDSNAPSKYLAFRKLVI